MHPPEPLWPARYHALDSLRFLAAVGVVLHHIAGVDMGILTGRIVVFFLISGYGVAASLERVVDAGSGVGPFLGRRMRRIFGPYLWCIAYWVVLTLLGWTHASHTAFPTDPVRWVTNLTLTQWIPGALNPGPPPWRRDDCFIAAHWSLGYEMQFYLLAAGAAWIAEGTGSRRAIAPLAAALGVAGLAWGAISPRGMSGLVIDFAFPFAIGGLLFWRLCVLESPRARRAVDATFAAGAAAAIAWCNLDAFTGANRRSIPEEVALVMTLAVLLIALRPLDTAWHATRIGRSLGACGKIAYPLFLVHPVNMPIAESLAGRILPGHAPGWLITGVELTVHIALAAAFWWFTERAVVRYRAAKPRVRTEATCETRAVAAATP